MTNPTIFGAPRRFEVDELCDGTELRVEIWYPRQTGAVALRVGLMGVRAACPLRIAYDFERDGWAIQRLDPIPLDEVPDGGVADRWVEAAFVAAWHPEAP